MKRDTWVWSRWMAPVVGVILAAGMLLAISCAPPKSIPPPETVLVHVPSLCLPQDLIIDSLGSHFVRLAWNPGCPETRIMQGFNIYLSRMPLNPSYPGTSLPSSVTPFNAEIYPGDTLGNPLRETFACENIANAVIYYAHVRVVNLDGTLSPPTNEVVGTCFQQGTVALAASFSGGHDGFNFGDEAFCRTDDPDNDLYYYYKDGADFLCSPSRLGPINRGTQLFAAGKGTTGQALADLGSQGDAADRISVRADQNLVLATPEGDRVAMYIRAIEGAESGRTIILEYLRKPAAFIRP